MIFSDGSNPLSFDRKSATWFLHRGLEPAEAEVISFALSPGKGDRPRISFLRQAVDDRSAGIGEVEQLRHLVEGLARGVVPRLSQQSILPELPHMVERGVPARGEQRDVGIADIGIFEVRGEDVAFAVVDADEGDAEAVGHGLGR